MKLYTEEQVKKAIYEAKYYDNGYASDKDILYLLTPIELPSDEEIEQSAKHYYDNNGADYYVELGAKWVIDKIKNQQQ
jgi:hypothetical protein